MNEQAISDLLDLLPIPGESRNEIEVANFIKRRLLDAGLPPSQIFFDKAHKQIGSGGNCGNLIVHLPGKLSADSLMFSAHMDTVPDCLNCRPRLDRANGRIVNDAPETALGGDNRAGCAILLALARELLQLEGNHPSIVLVFLIQEEVGLVGARGLDLSLLGETLPEMCFNLDGRRVSEVTIAAIGKERFNIAIKGKGALAGSGIRNGISAATIAALALAKLHHDGWHGAIDQPEGTGMANAGIFSGGKGSNIVMPDLHIAAEARSHDSAFRKMIVEKWREAFSTAAASVMNENRETGRVTFTPGPTYEAFSLSESAPIVQKVLNASKACGLKVRLVQIDGGIDANCLTAHGMPTVNLNVGQRNIHSTREWVNLRDFEHAIQLAFTLARG